MIDMKTPRSDGQHFEYRGYRFQVGCEPWAGGNYRPVVALVAGEVVERFPDDTEETVYASAAEAIRHAEQQAMRWVHDRTGTGQAQF